MGWRERIDTTPREGADAEREPRQGGSPSRAIALHVVAPISLGVVLYAVRGTGRLLIDDWLAPIGGARLDGGALAAMRAASPAWALVNLPDGLWTYALTAALGITWRSGAPSTRRAWLGAALALSLGLELGQLLRLVPGYFDGLDVLTSCAAWAVAWSLFGWERKQRTWQLA